MSRRKNFLIAAALAVPTGIGAIGVEIYSALVGLYDYVIEDGPYRSRTFSNFDYFVNPDDPLFRALTTDPEFSDKAGVLPDFS